MNKNRRRSWSAVLAAGFSLVTLALVLIACQNTIASSVRAPTQAKTFSITANPSPILPAPSATLDRLAEPPVPANPTQLEIGRHLYWMNCMPCHGDRGQGLTAEFRALYVEDANCWARGCHGGRIEDKGFPIPYNVPAIIEGSGGLPKFPNAQALFEFLSSKHPPQNPGWMARSDYWAITAYLLQQNGRLPEGAVLGQ